MLWPQFVPLSDHLPGAASGRPRSALVASAGETALHPPPLTGAFTLPAVSPLASSSK